METIYVRLLTSEQKDELVGNFYADDSYFNPIQDFNDNWIISMEEVEGLTNESFSWVRTLPIIEYIRK